MTAQLSCPFGGTSQGGRAGEVGGLMLFHLHQRAIQSGNQFLCLVRCENEGVSARQLRRARRRPAG
jgi:hypothetical protein